MLPRVSKLNNVIFVIATNEQHAVPKFNHRMDDTSFKQFVGTPLATRQIRQFADNIAWPFRNAHKLQKNQKPFHAQNASHWFATWSSNKPTAHWQ